MHHWKAAEILLSETFPVSKVPHLCEYMLLVDKVKEPRDIFELWNRLIGNRYHDFSNVFLHDGVNGWHQVLHELAVEEKECREKMMERNFSSTCLFERSLNRRLGLLGSRDLGIIFFFQTLINKEGQF